MSCQIFYHDYAFDSLPTIQPLWRIPQIETVRRRRTKNAPFYGEIRFRGPTRLKTGSVLSSICYLDFGDSVPRWEEECLYEAMSPSRAICGKWPQTGHRRRKNDERGGGRAKGAPGTIFQQKALQTLPQGVAISHCYLHSFFGLDKMRAFCWIVEWRGIDGSL